MTPNAKLIEEYPPPTKWNPRWVECHRNAGRRPKAWEFMLWNSARLAEFRKEAPDGCFWEGHVSDKGQAEYDKWLKANAGRKGWDIL